MSEKLRILLVGSGGREHALAWKLTQSPLVDHIYVLPGNGGTAESMPRVSNVEGVGPTDYGEMVKLARDLNINLVVPSSDAQVVDGIRDIFDQANIRCFAPSKAAAQLEGSKTFAKDFMMRHNIPTARYKNFNSYDEAVKHVEQIDYPIVVKASGLAAGKGVLLPKTKEEAFEGLKDIMVKKVFKGAGDEVVVEEYLEGYELSLTTFSDGSTFKSLLLSQDHKQIGDGDTGPNTGGMGCYAPAGALTPQLVKIINVDILGATFAGLREERLPFCGCLFTGLMITANGPRVLEYNVRPGDPETQTLMPMMRPECDLAAMIVACVENRLDRFEVGIKSGSCVTVVMASKGYPGDIEKGKRISINQDKLDTNTTIFHAGTKLSGDELVTSGGRVLAVTSVSDTLASAVAKAYANLQHVTFEGAYCRRDIAHRGLSLDSTTNSPPQPTSNSTPTPITYQSSGVSIDAGNDLVAAIKPLVLSTARPGTSSLIGGFGGDISLASAGYNPQSPRIVAAIDGIGTKIVIAKALRRFDTVGIDLVAMNVNDLVVQGAEPLGFLDYYGCGTLDVAQAASFVAGVVEGCKRACCGLVGGETAEMPSLYPGAGDFDAAGCAIGALPAGQRILPLTDDMREGDVLIGLASNGCHSNGFSLVRKVVERAGLEYASPAPWDPQRSVGESLLAPTRIYVRSLMAALALQHPRTAYREEAAVTDAQGNEVTTLTITRVPASSSTLIKGLAHITGGGLYENIPRMLPSHLSAEINVAAWPLPPVMRWLKAQAALDDYEFARTLNTGLGMVAVVGSRNGQDQVDEGAVKKIFDTLVEHGESVHMIGELFKRKGDEGVVLKGREHWQNG